jgi:hypothetical protein
MTEREKFIDVHLSLKESTYWKLVAIAAEDQFTVEDWLDEYLPAVVENLVTEKN